MLHGVEVTVFDTPGKLAPVIDGTYKLADVADASRHFGTGDHVGKIIVTLG